MQGAVGRPAFRLRHARERDTGGHELADAAVKMHADAVGLREGNKATDIDIADVARLPIENGSSVLCRGYLVPLRQGKQPPRIGHDFAR
jgi:hypothetical protein